MIQILALRPGRDGKSYPVWFEKGLRAPSVDAIFANPYEYIKNVPESERYNIYYTVADCLEESGRKLSEQHHLQFDIDGIEVPYKGDAIDEGQLGVMARVACKAIGVEFEKVGVLFSGNGLQIIVKTTHVITDPDFFDQTRKHYGSICDRIDLQLIQAKIIGKTDRSIWDSARIMRYPETLNVKAGKPQRMGILMNATMEALDYDVRVESKLLKVDAKDHIKTDVFNAYPTPDHKTIMKECKFLNWMQTHPADVTEPEWYAGVSITSRFENGHQFTHQISKGHPGYSFEETELKIKQALDASNPRTCENINAVSGGKCLGCKHYKTKLYTPIAIVGEDYIRTEKHGFHNFFVDEETGKTKIGKPNFEDLRKFFVRKHPYVSLEGAGIIRTWNGKYFDDYSRNSIRAFALEHFKPRCNESQRIEFVSEITLKNTVPVEWFTRSTDGKMNFQNGVYDIEKGILNPHSMEYGFRSILPCEYNPEARAPLWDKFLKEVTMDRQELIDIIQEFFGYSLANGPCKYQKMLMLLGSGANGKSKLVEVLRLLCGTGGHAALSVKDMRNEQNRYMLEGRLVNIAEENSNDSFRNTEVVKNFSRGGYISVKKVYETPYFYENKTKLIMLCNSLPRTTDLTHGFFRSFIMLPFDQVFSDAKGNRDNNIIDKLKPELTGIFNWAIEGYRRLERQGKFTESKAANRLLNSYKVEADNVLEWIEGEFDVAFTEDPTSFVNKETMYEKYNTYCENGNHKPDNQSIFFKKIKEIIEQKGFELIQKRTSEKGIRSRLINHFKMLDMADF